MTIQESIGKKIKTLREEKKISQTTLAEMVGYKDKTAIAKIEAGKVDLPQSKILAFSKALNISISYLLNDNTNISPKENNERILSTYDIKLLSLTDTLTDIGKKKVLNYTQDLSTNPIYQIEPQIPIVNAAHERTDIEITDEMKKHDDAFFDED